LAKRELPDEKSISSFGLEPIVMKKEKQINPMRFINFDRQTLENQRYK